MLNITKHDDISIVWKDLESAGTDYIIARKNLETQILNFTNKFTNEFTKLFANNSSFSNERIEEIEGNEEIKEIISTLNYNFFETKKDVATLSIPNIGNSIYIFRLLFKSIIENCRKISEYLNKRTTITYKGNYYTLIKKIKIETFDEEIKKWKATYESNKKKLSLNKETINKLQENLIEICENALDTIITITRYINEFANNDSISDIEKFTKSAHESATLAKNKFKKEWNKLIGIDKLIEETSKNIKEVSKKISAPQSVDTPNTTVTDTTSLIPIKAVIIENTQKIETLEKIYKYLKDIEINLIKFINCRKKKDDDDIIETYKDNAKDTQHNIITLYDSIIAKNDFIYNKYSISNKDVINIYNKNKLENVSRKDIFTTSYMQNIDELINNAVNVKSEEVKEVVKVHLFIEAVNNILKLDTTINKIEITKDLTEQALNASNKFITKLESNKDKLSIFYDKRKKEAIDVNRNIKKILANYSFEKLSLPPLPEEPNFKYVIYPSDFNTLLNEFIKYYKEILNNSITILNKENTTDMVVNFTSLNNELKEITMFNNTINIEPLNKFLEKLEEISKELNDKNKPKLLFDSEDLYLFLNLLVHLIYINKDNEYSIPYFINKEPEIGVPNDGEEYTELKKDEILNILNPSTNVRDDVELKKKECTSLVIKNTEETMKNINIVSTLINQLIEWLNISEKIKLSNYLKNNAEVKELSLTDSKIETTVTQLIETIGKQPKGTNIGDIIKDLTEKTISDLKGRFEDFKKDVEQLKRYLETTHMVINNPLLIRIFKEVKADNLYKFFAACHTLPNDIVGQVQSSLASIWPFKQNGGGTLQQENLNNDYKLLEVYLKNTSTEIKQDDKRRIIRSFIKLYYNEYHPNNNKLNSLIEQLNIDLYDKNKNKMMNYVRTKLHNYNEPEPNVELENVQEHAVEFVKDYLNKQTYLAPYIIELSKNSELSKRAAINILYNKAIFIDIGPITLEPNFEYVYDKYVGVLSSQVLDDKKPSFTFFQT